MSLRVDQVSIQLQRPLAFPDALSGAVGVDLDNAQAQMGNCIFRDRGTKPRFRTVLFGGGKPRYSIVWRETHRIGYVHISDGNPSPNVRRIEREGALEANRRASPRFAAVMPLSHKARP